MKHIMNKPLRVTKLVLYVYYKHNMMIVIFGIAHIIIIIGHCPGALSNVFKHQSVGILKAFFLFFVLTHGGWTP